MSQLEYGAYCAANGTEWKYIGLGQWSLDPAWHGLSQRKYSTFLFKPCHRSAGQASKTPPVKP